MNTVFISYSHLDAAVAAQIRDWLHRQEFHSLFVAFDFRDGIAPGSRWETELLRNLRRSDVVLALCSEPYAESRWCFAELVYAKAHEKPIIPVRLDTSPPHELLSDTQGVDFSQHATEPQEAYEGLSRALAERGIRPQIGGRWTGERPPYPGLAAFQEVDTPVFFGRDEETRNALTELRRLRRPDAPRLLVMLGASGCGKSSLLKAGMLPHLRADIFEWVVVEVFRPGAQPLTRMAQALAATFERSGTSRNWQDIRELLRAGDAAALRDLGEELRYLARAPDARVVLIVDQLEEALLQPPESVNQSSPDELPTFLSVLRQLADMREACYFIVSTLRSDFLGSFQIHPTLQGIRCATLTVAPPSKAGFARLIEGPAELARLELEDGLATLMVADTGTPDALPLLAFTLRELYEKHAQDRWLTIEEYRSQPPVGLGGLQGALAQAAEDVITHQNPPLADERIRTLRTTFLSMVALTERGEPTRRSVRWSTLPPDVHPLVEQFVQARLLVAREMDGEREIEVVHEALFRSWGRLSAWLDENRTFLLWRKDLERQLLKWQAGPTETTDSTGVGVRGRSSGGVLRDDDLARARTNLARYGDLLNGDERDYIQASIRTDRRRRVIVRSAVAATMVLLAAAALFARQQGIRASERASDAKRATLLATARAFRTDHTRAGALMRESSGSTNEFLGVKATILEGHTKPVRAIAFSPDGRLVLTASEDETARLWNADGSGEPVILKGHTSIVTVASFDAAGKRVVTGSEDETVRVWNVDGSGEPKILRGHSQGIALAVFSRDGRRLVTAARRPSEFIFKTPPDNNVRVWDLEAPGEPRVLTGHTSTITGAGFVPSGTHIVTASEDGTTRVWDVNGSAPAIVLNAGEPVTALAVSPDGRMIVAGCSSGTIHVWRNAGPATPRVLTGHTAAVTAIVFAPDGDHVVSGSEDGTARVWRLNGGTETSPGGVLGGHTGGVGALALSPDGMQIVTASADNTARIWRRDGTPNSPLSDIVDLLFTKIQADGLNAAQMFRDMNRAELPSMVDQMRRMNEDLARLSGHNGRIAAMAWSPDGRRIATASADKSARIWRLDGPPWISVLRSRTSGPSTWALSDDGERLLDVNDDIAQIRNADGAGVPITFPQPDPAVAVAFGANASSVLTGSKTGTVRIWQLDHADAKVIGVMSHTSGSIDRLLLDRGRKRLAVLSAAALSLWDVANPQRVRQIQTVADISGGMFTPDGTQFVGLARDTFVIVDARQGHVRVLLSSPEYVRDRSGFRLTADGRSIVSCFERPSRDRAAVYLLWDIRREGEWPTRLTDYKFGGHELTAPGRSPLSLSPYDISSGDPCTASESTNTSVSVSANGRRVATRIEFDRDDNGRATGLEAWTIVATLDVQTLLWKQIDYCFSSQERMDWLGESAGDAEGARRCCQSTVSVCRDSTFDACAAAVRKNYSDPLRPCGR